MYAIDKRAHLGGTTVYIQQDEHTVYRSRRYFAREEVTQAE